MSHSPLFKGTGQVGAGLYVLGPPHFPVYGIQAERPVLVDACIHALGDHYLRDIKATFPGNPPARLFLTHAHFDHCGAVGYLKSALPGLEVLASEKAASILTRPNAIKLISHLNRDATRMIRTFAPDGLLAGDFQPFTVDRTLKDGQRLELAEDLTIQAIASPGHTWDFMAYYFPERRLLISGESTGTLQPGGLITNDFLVDFEAYQASMDRLAELEVDYLAQGHYCVHLGQGAAQFIRDSKQASLVFRDKIYEFARAEDNVLKRVMQRLVDWEYETIPPPKQPFAAYTINLQYRVKYGAPDIEFTGPPLEA